MKISWVVSFFIFLFQAHLANAVTNEKIAPKVLEQVRSGATVDVLFLLRPQADLSKAEQKVLRAERVLYVRDQLRSIARSSQKNLLQILSKNGLRHQPFFITNAIAAYGVPASTLRKLAQLPEVQRIVPNESYSLQTIETPKMPLSFAPATLPNNITEIKADRVWNELNIRGDGIVIAGQDTGFDWRHPALRLQYRGFLANSVSHNYNWHSAVGRSELHQPEASSLCRDEERSEPCDDNGHGTHTMGSMVGDDGAVNKIGVAPGARWIGCRNMENGVGSPATYLECFEWFLAPYPFNGNSFTDGRPELAPHIVNNSWSCPTNEGCTSDTLIGAVRSLTAAGILVVVAAGNDGPNCGSVADPPGSYAGEVLAVGAYNFYGRDVAYFSARGPSRWNGGQAPDVIAPGAPVRSAAPGGGYDERIGTSMASPHAAAVAALMWSANPALIGKVRETIALIQQTAEPRATSESCAGIPNTVFPNPVWGFGMIDAYAAVQAALAY